MKIQTANIHRQYLKMLATAKVPGVGTVTVNRAGICFVARFESEKDIDNYLAEVREKLIE